MNTELRILILEDAPEDAELIKRQLSEGKLQFTARTVDNKRDFLKELKEFKPDIILSDYSLPQFTGLEALDIVKEIAPSTPFIIITGTINEETAVSCIKAGAWDYIIKDRLVRLGAAVKSALELKEERFKKEQVLQALRESERELKEAQRIGRIGHWEFNLATGQISWSDMIFALYKRDPKLGPPTTEEEAAYYSPEDAKMLRNLAERAIKTGEPWEVDISVRLPGERLMNCVSMGKPIKDARGQVIKLYGTVQDITEWKQAEEILRESEEKYRSMFEHKGTASIIVEQDAIVSQINGEFERLSGYSRDEIEGKRHFYEFIPDEDRERLLEYHTLQRKKGGNPPTVYEAKVIDKQGAIRHVIITASLIPGTGKSIVCLVDITSRINLERDRIRLQTAIEQLTESIMIHDKHMAIHYINPAFEKLTGLEKSDIIGKTPQFLMDEDNASVYENILGTIKEGRNWSGRIEYCKKNGPRVWCELTITPIFDIYGTIVNFISVIKDITQELLMEKRLQQVQKIEAIGTLAGGIAHDFNNILSAVIGYAELSMEVVAKDSQVYEDLNNIYKAGARAKDLINQILIFSRQHEEEKKPINIVPIIKEVLKLLRSTLPTTIEIAKNIDPHVGSILADTTQVHQILMNLCTNAGHAMRENGGVLEVTLGQILVDNEFKETHPNLEPGMFVKLSISDTGCGMPQEIVDRIFEPYFTTKEKTGGTGLGLAVVHGIVESYGGAITVYSKPGTGTAFNVYLPVCSVEAYEEENNEGKIPTGNERILIIDDEQNIEEINRRMLTNLGYDVTVATSSIEALDLFTEEPDRFDLVISDMTMPQMSGDQLAKAMLEIRANIPIIICTGYSERITMGKVKGIDVRAFLMKPLNKSVLARTVRDVLDMSVENS